MRRLVLLFLIASACSQSRSVSSTRETARRDATLVATPAADAHVIDADAQVFDAQMLDASMPDAGVDASVDAGRRLGKHGDVCQLSPMHARGRRELEVRECGPGLRCCYPCGIQGCDDICMTPAECNVRRP